MKHILLLLCLLLGGISVSAQNVIRKGNIFMQVSNKEKVTYEVTPYTYVASDGTKYPIYISCKRKYFIIRKSKKTGKEYRQELKEVEKLLFNEKSVSKPDLSGEVSKETKEN